jgi:hypothetical protein
MMGLKEQAGKEAEMAERIQSQGTPSAPVTTSDGKAGK